MADTEPTTAACRCAGGALPPPWHHDNCPVLLAWLTQGIAAGEAEIAAANELRTLDDI